MIKKISYFILILLLLFAFVNTVKASTIGDIFTDADKFVESGKGDLSTTIDDSKLKDISNLVYKILLIIGIAVLVIWGSILGIQFITGSVGDKVKVKESLMAYLVGAIIILSAFGIWTLVIKILR